MNNNHVTFCIRNILGTISSYYLIHKYKKNFNNCCCCVCHPRSRFCFAKETEMVDNKKLNASSLRYVDAETQKIKELTIDKQKTSQNKKDSLPVEPRLIPTPRYHDIKEQKNLKHSKMNTEAKLCTQTNNSGLLYYRKWWERHNVEISVNGKIIEGVPIFIEQNTLRVVNKKNSFFIPLEKIDYIRTPDGLDPCAEPDNKAETDSIKKMPNT